MKRALIIMAKAPVAGKVKTRLQPELSAEAAAELAVCFLRDTINKVARLEAENKIIVAYSPAAEKNFFASLAAAQNAVLVEQKGNDLGEKMFFAFAAAFAQEPRIEAVVMIGTDSPTFPADYIEQAFEFLETNSDAVLGKTEDGGFFLIGLRQSDKRIFENVEWSSAKTFAQTRENIMRLGWHLREVPGWYDIDEPRDLEQLKREFLHNKNARRRAPETFAWITKNL